MIQNIIVIIIGTLVIGYVGWKVYKMLTRKPSPADKCGGCTGCALKVNIDCNDKKKS
jgi:hypothetical protein